MKKALLITTLFFFILLQEKAQYGQYDKVIVNRIGNQGLDKRIGVRQCNSRKKPVATFQY